jgi:hypothetical protein
VRQDADAAPGRDKATGGTAAPAPARGKSASVSPRSVPFGGDVTDMARALAASLDDDSADDAPGMLAWARAQSFAAIAASDLAGR